MKKQKKMTLEALQKRRQSERTATIPTKYGFEVTVQRCSARAVLAFQSFVGPDKVVGDPVAAYSGIIEASLVDPAPSPELIAELAADWESFFDLGEKLLEFQGLSRKAHEEAGQTFRPGDEGPRAVPQGS